MELAFQPSGEERLQHSCGWLSQPRTSGSLAVGMKGSHSNGEDLPRAEAVERTLTTLRFFWRSKQGPEPDATGYKGYYHFLDMQTGARARYCEL